MATTAEKLEAGSKCAKRVSDEAAEARRTWALVMELNGVEEKDRKPLRDAAKKLGLWEPLDSIRRALIRDTVSTLLRVTDNRASDRLTLCKISDLLADDEVAKKLIEDARNWIPESPIDLANCDAKTCADAISFIKARVAPKWNDEAPPIERRLFDLRAEMRPVRDALLAHSLSLEDILTPRRDDVCELLALVSDLAEKAQLIFLGQAASWESHYRGRRKEADELFRCLQNGLERGFCQSD